MLEKKVSFTITLSADEVENLKCWAGYHGKTKGGYAAQIIGSRIEANLELINSLIRMGAESRGITTQEMRAIWIGDQETEG